MTETLSPLFDAYSASLFFIALKTVLTYVTYLLACLSPMGGFKFHKG